MNQAASLFTQDSRRAEARISTIPLELEIRKSRPFNLGRFHYCTFIDINMGGLGVVSDILNLRILDRVDLRVHHNNKKYFVRGIIGYRQDVSGGVQYGIIFVEVPGELDSQIMSALESSNQNFDTPLQMKPGTVTTLAPGTQRRIDIRRKDPVMSMSVRKPSALSPALDYEVTMVDISKHGIGFISNTFQCTLMTEIELTLGYKEMIFTAKGTICFADKSEDSYHYGVKFSQVSHQYIHLLETTP